MWQEKSKRAARLSENGKSDLDNESPVSLTLARGLGARLEREVAPERGKGLSRAPGSPRHHSHRCLGWERGELLVWADLGRAFHWAIPK